jgi:hypothetical protein
MKMKVLVLSAFLVFAAGYLFSYEIADYPYKSKYDSMFVELNDITTISNSLDDSDLDIVFSAMKRAAQLKMVELKGRISGLVGESNPAANQGKDVRLAEYRHIFNMGLLVLGKLGDESDAGMLAGYLHDMKDPVSISCGLQALGDLSTSKKALNSLNDYTTSVSSQTDSRVVKQLIDSILMHNSRSSISFLFTMQGRVSQAQRDYVNTAIKRLNAKGHAVTNK